MLRVPLWQEKKVIFNKMRRGRVTYRLRIPVATRRRRRTVGSISGGRRSRKMRGGFLPLLAPIIAAAIGAIPGIASVALAAKKR
ncbi:pX [red squirrel adenovirus 1]|uniref:PX n=1 Tax=red squirrel adenovirus 1 TaxID=2773314 RepID=A0A240FBG2_9ADEN|nr:pX [red squirrel adenovirus 1]ARE31887.1 pX [red squirrel adenovirus 1]WUG45428.1 pX [Squirrel mastadenovirus A]